LLDAIVRWTGPEGLGPETRIRRRYVNGFYTAIDSNHWDGGGFYEGTENHFWISWTTAGI
jgi:hypothetical protein